MAKRESFKIGGETLAAGTRRTIDIPVSVLSDHTPVSMSAHVIHGRRSGPTLFLSAAIHGDEIIGVEILRRVLRNPSLNRLKGTLIVVPVVNSFGFLNRSRYLPDRRDLNRVFPGSSRGSLASRLAHLFMTEIVERSDFGIDIHSASIHRSNLPQIRISAAQPESLKMAKAFGAPLVLISKIREGSLRDAAKTEGIDVLLFEAGEGLRFDEYSVRTGVAGILRVMRKMDMIARKGVPKRKTPSIVSRSSSWVRSPAGGLLRTFVATGDQVKEGDSLGCVADPFGDDEIPVIAPKDGLLIGRTHLPVINEGDGLYHIAEVHEDLDAESTIDTMASALEEASLFDEDEII